MAKNKKLIATVAAVATSAALLLGGTLAWQSTNQTALNEASDVINPGGRLHDDFDGTNKDVYVENFAEEDIFARVRLEEFFEIIVNHGTDAEKTHSVIGTKKLKDGAVADPENNPSGANLYDYTYVVHKFNTTDNETEDAGMDREGTAFWNWKLGGSTVYMPTFNKNKDSLAADLNGNYVDAVGGISNRDGNQYENYVKYTDGETLEGTEIYDDDANDVDDDGILEVAEIDHTAKPTGSATLMSMQEWIGAGSPVGEYWVYDTDGWVYWADAIKPDSATGLLLDGIELNQKMDDTWYYAINVVAQFVTADDLGSAEDGTGFYTETDKYPAPSEDALKLLDKIGVDVGNAGETPDDPGEDDFTPTPGTVTSDGGNISLYIDSPSISVNGNTITINPYAEEDLTYNAAATLTGTGKTWQEVDKSIYKLNTETDGYEECSSTPLNVMTETGVDIDIATEDTYGEYAGTYMITAQTTDTDAEGNPTWQGELVLNVEYYQDSTGGEESPAYEPNLYTNAQTYVAGDSVSFDVYVYDETYELAKLTTDNLSITATAADGNDVSDAITSTLSSDGYTATATLDTTGLTGAVTVAAVYTDAEGNEYPAEPITINEVFNASEFLTLDGKQTNVVHPDNSYTLAYTGESGPYSFALTQGDDVAALSGNILTINGDAAEYAQIAITVTDSAGNEVETASLTVTHTPIVKVVAPEDNKRELEVTPASNSDWVTVLANESVSLFMGDDVPLTIEKFSYAGDYGLTPDEIATINDDGASITPHLGSTIVSAESAYTSGDLSFDVRVTMEVEFPYSVSVNYSLNGSDAKLADESVIFLSEGDSITFYASSDQPTPATQFGWKIGEHGNIGTTNIEAFGPLNEDEEGSLNGVSTDTDSEYRIASVSDMEKQLDYHFYVSADNHNHAWFQVIFGEPALDGADTIMQGDTQDYYTNDLKDYTYSVTPAIEGVEISRYGELYVPKDVPVGTVLTITATPDGFEGETLTKDVTVVAFDYSSMVLYVGDYESFGEEYYTTDYTTFTLSVEAFDRNGDAVSASDLEWSVADSGYTPIDNILTEYGDGTCTLDLSGQTDTIHVHVNYTGDNEGENSSVSCAFYYEYEGGGEEEDAYLGRIELAEYAEQDNYSLSNDDSPVPIIDTARTRAVYFEAYDTNGYTYSDVTWSCNSGLVDETALASGKVIAAAGASVSSIEELTITATDNTTYDTDTFTVMMYDSSVHTLVDTIDNGDYYHIFRPAEANESSTEYCVIRHDLPLPYCMLHLDYIGADEHDPDLWNLIGAYDEMLVSPNDARESVAYISICTHGQEGANDNYPQDAEPMFSVASENSRLYWLGLTDGESFSEVYPGDTLQVTSTILNGIWSVHNETADEDVTFNVLPADQIRSRITFTIPDGTIGKELVITQTIGDEEYSIRTTVADPGPTFTVMLDGEEIAADLPTSGNVNLPICGLTDEVTVTVSSTYETYANGDWIEGWHVSGWKNDDDYDNEANYYDEYFSPTDDTITFHLDPTEWEFDASIDVDQSTDSGFWTLYLRITKAEEESAHTLAIVSDDTTINLPRGDNFVLFTLQLDGEELVDTDPLTAKVYESGTDTVALSPDSSSFLYDRGQFGIALYGTSILETAGKSYDLYVTYDDGSITATSDALTFTVTAPELTLSETGSASITVPVYDGAYIKNAAVLAALNGDDGTFDTDKVAEVFHITADNAPLTLSAQVSGGNQYTFGALDATTNYSHWFTVYTDGSGNVSEIVFRPVGSGTYVITATVNDTAYTATMIAE